MANRKEVAVINAIVGLCERGWSQRRIARELGIDRETVGRYVRLWREGGLNPAIPTPGIDGPDGPKPAIPTPGVPAPEGPNPAISTPGPRGRPSLCEPFRERIEKALEGGLTAQRIYQDLVCETDFASSYQSVKRFVRRLRVREPKRFYRLECLPGEEAQVDFGSGPRVVDAAGRARKTWIFRVVLSHSRKAYSEAVRRQDTETFLRCLENAFRHFGGVPQMLVIDNLRAAVKKADWFEPELNPKAEAFCRHYGTVILPTRPYHPHHKGKVENAIGYVKKNALKGRSFFSLGGLNRFLLWWEEHVADRRIHGTTRKQVGRHFEEVERKALGPLPAMPFPCFNEAKRKVHRDSHVEVARAYYEAPPEYVGREVWVRWDARTVRIFNSRLEQVAVHGRLEPGRFSSQSGSRDRARGVERTGGYYYQQVALMGLGCGRWAREVLKRRGFAAVRILQGLLSLSREHPAEALDAACGRALSYGALRLRDVRRLLNHPDRQQDLLFMETHPLIRDMSAYGQFIHQQTTEPEEVMR